VPVDGSGSVAVSPVVLATSRAAAEELGWTRRPPTWGEALTSGRALAVPDLSASAEGLSALAVVRNSLGNDADADNAVVSAVLAAGRGGGPATLGDALAAARDGGTDAPLVPVSEQELLAANEGVDDPTLVAVYPRDGSPALDYPVLRVGETPDAERPAVDAVVRALTSRGGHPAAREAGFRSPDGAAPRDAGPRTGTQQAATALLRLEPGQVSALLDRLSSLAAPIRLLAVFDVSASMAERVGDGTRATLARDAAKSALTLFPDRSALALWVFARRLNGDSDWQELVPMRTLGTDVDGRPQRAVLAEQLDTVPDRLRPGGTGLYDTVLSAFRHAKADHSDSFVSSIVVITDGRDEDGGSVGLEGLVSALRQGADPARPVKIIGIALGPDADLGALRQIADATGGAAYPATDPNDLQTVLFDALRQRQ
jgi:Ca-activated chloride channel homolog